LLWGFLQQKGFPTRTCGAMHTLLLAKSRVDLHECPTQVAGGYGMAGLYGVVPPLMAWRLRYGSGSGGGQADEWVPGGRAALAVLCTSAVAVEVGQLSLDLHWL